MKKLYKANLSVCSSVLAAPRHSQTCAEMVSGNSEERVGDRLSSGISGFTTAARCVRYLVIMLTALLLSVKTYAQENIKITGTVTDTETGKSIPGASVKVKNTNNGTATDDNGHFALTVSKSAILQVSFIGYASVEKQVTGSIVNIKLTEGAGSLSEVVVTGYGSSSKSQLASAISSVSSKDYKDAVVTTLDQALQGRVSGVQVTTESGEPGSDAVIRIRGNNSLSGDNQPLYVIDGFPMPTYTEAGGSVYGSFQQNGLYGINPNDIESIDVLKDAAATAIYGSRGANGVILIKTKTGKRGTSRIEFVDKTSMSVVRNPYQMLNSAGFADIINQEFGVQGMTAPFSQSAISGLSGGTNWWKAVTQTGFREEPTLNISGGSDKTTYYISGDYLSDKGNIVTSLNRKGSITANINSQVNNWYTVKGQLSVTRQNTTRAISDSRGFPAVDGPVLDALRASPLVSTNYAGFDGEGIPGYTDGNVFDNPLTDLKAKTDQLLSDFTLVNISNDFKILPDLKLSINLGSSHELSGRQEFFPATTGEGYNVNGAGSNNINNTYSYNVNAYLNYHKEFSNNSTLDVTGGTEYNKETLTELNTSSSDYAIPAFGINNIGSAGNQSIGSYKQQRLIESAFFRANYSFKDRYVINTSIRLDGASPFAENKKFGVFPAVGFAWNLNKEDFMKDVTWVTNSKFRASYGETGSQAITPYSSLSQYSYDFYQTGTASTINTVLYPSSLGNNNLSWERTKQFDAGTDFSLFKNFLNVSFDYYQKTTDGLLQQQPLPSQSGFTSVISNYGSMRNSGVELTLSANVVHLSDFKWNTKVMISHNQNVLLNLGTYNSAQYVGLGGNLTGGVSGILQPGKEVGLFYGYKVIGLVQTGDIVGGVPNYAYPGSASDQLPGGWKFQDTNHDGVINSNDRVVLGNSNPKFTYGWNNDINYKKFGLSLFFTGSQGNDVLNLTETYLTNGIPDNSNIFFNQTQDWYDHRWTPANPTNNPKYPGIQKALTTGDINSTMVQNGSYFRLKSATISYSLPDNKVLKNARIFVTGTNLFTITKYTGFDPEVSSYGQSLLQQGIDFGSYPMARTYTLGISTNF